MSIQKNIGKNTIGDNKKMEIDLRTYNRSTHNLSTIIRNTQSVGTLVPTLTLVMQKDDTFEINIESSVLTHPTTGPLYGSFKLENHLFFIPFRLYNSWLHNNRLGIGLNMSQIKLPQLVVNLKKINDQPGEDNLQWSQINPSCLLSYLGIKGYGGFSRNAATTVARKNAVKILGYWDIFKNYYANKQEELAYFIGSNDPISAKINQIPIKNPNNIGQAEGTVATGEAIKIKDPNKVYTENNVLLWVTQRIGHSPVQMTAGEAGSTSWAENVFTITLHNIPEGVTWWIRTIQSTEQQALQTFNLNEIDKLRDEILTTQGNVSYNLKGDETEEITLKKMFGERGPNQKLKSTRPQYGLLLRTYNSDLYQNWINTEWIEGANGINEISSVDVTDGKLSMDALNLAQKVYNMLNRIAISGGTYRDWLETVYASGQYIERCETPTFEGGTSQEIVFQEVVSNSATEDEPLGTLAGRGINAGKQKGGKIKIRATEPGYIMSITSITPRIDYSQGNDFDTDWETIDDMHKPALDGIGYQDSVNTGRAWWDDTFTNTTGTLQKHAAGKTVAWIDYMTNVNRTYGNFASGMSEAFMVLNRNYQMKIGTDGNTLIDDLTTYIDPVKYNYIFADTSIDAMNFWLQIKYEITARRLMSAKQIPNL
nr:MAG TPA: Major capsid protein [Microviridae sp.]